MHFKTRFVLAILIVPMLVAAEGDQKAPVNVPAPEPAAPVAEPKDREAFKRGLMAFKQKQFDATVEAFGKVAELGGFLSLYKHWFLGQAYLELGRYKEADAELSKLITGQASTELQYQAQFLLGEVALRQKNYKDVADRLGGLEKKWRRSYRFPEVLYKLMIADLNLSQTASLCRRARKLYADHPANFLVVHWGSDLGAVVIEDKKLPCRATRDDFSSRIRSLQWAGESEKAHREITELLAKAKEGERVALDLILANFLVNEGSVDDALNKLIRYYPQQKTNVGYLMLLGKAAARSGEYQTAVGAYERAHSLAPRTRRAREALFQAAYLSYQVQDYDGAVRKFQQFVKANPKSGLARDAEWHLAWLQYLRRDYKGALKKFEEVAQSAKSKRKHSDSLQERLNYWIAMSHIRLKQYEEAAKSLEAIMAKNMYSYYGLAAEARLHAIKGKLAAKSERVPASLRPAPSDGISGAVEAEARESEEDLVEAPSDEPAPLVTEEGGEADGIRASSFKDPALRARIDVADNLIQLGLNELARWELVEVEKRTRNTTYLRLLIGAYEKINSYHRSAAIGELSFGRERELHGIEQGRSLWAATYPQAFKNLVQKYSGQVGVPEEWVWAIMRAESLYKPDVISPVGAKGLLQLMPYTARNLVRLAGGSEEPNILEPETNIKLGSAYLARLRQKFKGNFALAAAAYNAGPHRVDTWLVNFGHLDTDEFIEHIPFLETRNYAKKVMRNHTFYRRLYAKDQSPAEILSKPLGVPIPARAPTRESWDSL